MLRQRIFTLAIVAGQILPAVMGCLMPSVAQAQTMECCAQSACAGGHQRQTCFSTTTPTGASQSNPELRASLAEPSFTTGLSLPAGEQAARDFGLAGATDAQQHSPPLYTLHLAFLI
jgi:hypothetical protein